MNCYANLSEIKARLLISETTYDAVLLAMLEEASREIERFTRRQFHLTKETRYFGAKESGLLLVDDLLAVTSLTTDSEGDETFDGETWTEGTHYRLGPENSWPKWQAIRKAEGAYSFAVKPYYAKVTGIWGVGDGLGASPWEAAGTTGAVATTTGTTLALGTTGILKAGMTIQVESEWMFVQSVTDGESPSATVKRAVNGSAAAAHSAADVYKALYPADVRLACLRIATALWNTQRDEWLTQELVGGHQRQLMIPAQITAQMHRMLGSWERLVA